MPSDQKSSMPVGKVPMLIVSIDAVSTEISTVENHATIADSREPIPGNRNNEFNPNELCEASKIVQEVKEKL